MSDDRFRGACWLDEIGQHWKVSPDGSYAYRATPADIPMIDEVLWLRAEVLLLRAEIDSLSLALKSANDAGLMDRADAERIRFLAAGQKSDTDPYPYLCDGFAGIDLHEEAAINASAFGREEPNADDYLAAFRTAIDAARKEGT